MNFSCQASLKSILDLDDSIIFCFQSDKDGVQFCWEEQKETLMANASALHQEKLWRVWALRRTRSCDSLLAELKNSWKNHKSKLSHTQFSQFLLKAANKTKNMLYMSIMDCYFWLQPTRDDPDCTPAGLIEACLKGDGVDRWLISSVDC